jgi:DNA (cytosine-5)-methyltransferase 1
LTGGIDLAAQWAGIETVAFCEIDIFCQKILNKHWTNIPIFDDIRKLDKEVLDNANIKEIDIVAGGYPCQPFSVAGKRKGEKDGRYMWAEMFRIIQEIKPTWVIGENVKGHLSLGLDAVLSDLGREGYITRTFVYSAKAVGANHNRERVFIVSHAAGNGRDESEESTSYGKSNEWSKERQKENCNYERLCSIWTDMERCSREVRSWGTESPALRVDDGLPYRMDRNRVIGNAVVPQQIYPILQIISEIGR